MSRKQDRYTGKLASPITIPNPPTFWGAVTDERVNEHREAYVQHQKQIEGAIRSEIAEKIKLLFRVYAIDNEDISALALALAFRHVPGFKIVWEGGERRGRKKVWDGPKLQALHETVQTVKSKHQFRDRRNSYVYRD